MTASSLQAGPQVQGRQRMVEVASLKLQVRIIHHKKPRPCFANRSRPIRGLYLQTPPLLPGNWKQNPEAPLRCPADNQANSNTLHIRPPHAVTAIAKHVVFPLRLLCHTVLTHGAHHQFPLENLSQNSAPHLRLLLRHHIESPTMLLCAGRPHLRLQ